MERSGPLSRIGIEKFKVSTLKPCGNFATVTYDCSFVNDDQCTYYYYRYNATDDDIKRAYRKIVLKHHPDKRKAQGENVHTDDDYFTCITKAYETLGKLRKKYKTN